MALYGGAKRKRKAEDEHQTFTRKKLGGYWQTKRHGKMHGTVPFGSSAQTGGASAPPRAGIPKAPGRGGSGNLQGKESLKALYMQKKRRR